MTKREMFDCRYEKGDKGIHDFLGLLSNDCHRLCLYGTEEDSLTNAQQTLLTFKIERDREMFNYR